MESVTIQIINSDSPLYKDELKLRDEILRKPINLKIENDDLSDEVNQIHFVALLDTAVVGVVVLKIEGQVGKLRQMAVNPEIQGKQIGRKLVNALEAYAKENGIKEIKLHARHYASVFYEKLGYANTSKPAFEEVGMKHFEMAKVL
ncbi:GNAT family N-acetyltransferase [Arcticibacterium luteifluviistationis]|uniref:GNAT family N-acetyltransferase n=1 Tax=Arcticibacterium luteifluviistationis TaxID=1784714 RepID=A0A2Z4G6B4_9BACT|nr:GNAT family N-acetyltransferase [Arcticibacterium luteifluviistationis]AWV96677.1 GNAT family N-acetyltransferase [Arcticibacterium luteifluviistationis]